MRPDARSTLLTLAFLGLSIAPARAQAPAAASFDPPAEASEPDDAVISLPDGVVRVEMRYTGKDAPGELTTLRMKPRAELERILTGLHRTPQLAEFLCQPRAGVQPKERDAALATARATLATISADWTLQKDLSQPDRYEVGSAFTYAALVLVTWGGPADVDFLLAAKPGEQSWARERRISAAAQLEARLGLLETGRVATYLASTERSIAVHAAVLLDAFGSSRGDEVLYAALLEPTPPGLSAAAGLALIDHADARTLEAMRALLARDEALPSKDWPSWSVSRVSPWLSAVVHLLAFGDSADRARATARPCGSAHAEMLAFLVEDPAALLAGIARNQGWQPAAIAAQALRTLPPRRAAAVEECVRKALQQRGFEDRPEKEEFTAEEQAYRQTLFYELMRSYERPSAKVAERVFKQSIFLGAAPWIAAPWQCDAALDALVEGTIVGGGRDQLDYVPHDRLVAGLEKRKAAEKLLDAPVYAAWHGVATRGFSTRFDAFPDGVERRPYVLSHDGYDGGSISGVLHERATLVGRTLRVELAQDQASYYHVGGLIDFNGGVRENWAHHRYVKDGGRALIAKVAARRGDRQFAGKEITGAAGGAAPAFEIELDGPSLADLWVEVTFEFFGEHHDFVFPLWDSDLARSERRAGASKGVAHPAHEPLDALARADVCARSGDLEGAWDAYRLVLVDRPWDRALWFRAADMFAAKGEHARAADVLWTMVQYFGDDADVWSDLGTELYTAGDYEGAGEAWRSSLIADPDQEEPKLWWSASLYLDGRTEAAREVLDGIAAPCEPRLVASLRYVFERKAGRDGAAARHALEVQCAKLGAAFGEDDIALLLVGPAADSASAALLAGTRDAQARVHCNVAYACLFAGDRAKARLAFERAVAAGTSDALAVRLAQSELEGLSAQR